jgi:hypothetical protein
MTTINRKQEVIALLDEFDSSGLSITQFCRERNFPYHSFKYWYRKLRSEKKTAPVKKKFIPINFSAPAPNSVIAEIRYPSGTCVLLYAIDNIEKLKTLL